MNTLRLNAGVGERKEEGGGAGWSSGASQLARRAHSQGKGG